MQVCMICLVASDWVPSRVFIHEECTCTMQCCVWGYSGDLPPQDEQGFQDFVASLEKPDVHEVICASLSG